MDDKNLKSIIYISKRCPYCRKLLLLLQNKSDLKGSIQITCIDDEPFPKIIKSVPSMISNGEIWTADELFAILEGRDQQQQPQQQQQQQQHPQQQQQQQQQPGGEGGDLDELDGYFNDSGLGGSGLGFATLDDNNVNNSYFASIDEKENSIDVTNDGHVQKNKKTEAFDSDYERMMAERGQIEQGGMRMGGGGL